MFEIYFEIKTPLNVVVRVTRSYWEKIVNHKHPIMRDKEDLVKEALRNPVVIHKSTNDESVHLYYTHDDRYYLCVAVKHLNGNGFIITAYRTDKIKIGEKVWPL